jgi:hypothetical protein
MDGTEMANAIYENYIDASTAFCAITQQITHYNDDINLKIEDVVGSLENGRGMYAGVPGFVIVLSKCDGGCHSQIWN